MQTSPISWEREANARLPVQVWRDMMWRHYPDSAWLCLRRDAFDRLNEYRSRHGLLNWEQALDRLLADELEPLPLESEPVRG